METEFPNRWELIQTDTVHRRRSLYHTELQLKLHFRRMVTRTLCCTYEYNLFRSLKLYLINVVEYELYHTSVYFSYK